MIELKDENFLLSELLEKKNGEPLYSLFIGAGCSISSGVLSSAEIIFTLKKKAYTNNSSSKNKDKYIAQQELKFKNILRSHFLDTYSKVVPLNLKAKAELNKEEYIDKLYQMFEYGFWFNETYRMPFQRWQFIENMMDKIEPSVHYIFLAEAILNGLTRNIFTTNFDNLLSTGLLKYFNCTPRVYQLEYEVTELIRTNTNRPSIIKLHGDFLYKQNHTPIETAQLQNFHTLFETEISQRGLLVLGYNGMDNSVMSIIEKAKIGKPQNEPLPLIWCDIVEFKDLSWRVRNLLENGHNTYYIKIKSFEDISLKLWALFASEIPSFINKAYSKENEVRYTLLRQLNNKNDFNYGLIKAKFSKIEKNIKDNYDLFFLDYLEYPFTKEKVEQEIKDVENKIILFEGSPEIRKLEYRKALLLKRSKNFVDSEKLFKSLLKKYPFFEEGYISLAHIYILRYLDLADKRGKTGETLVKNSIKYLKLSIELNKFNYISHHLIAKSYYNLDNFQESFYHYSESTKLNPLYLEPLEGMAYIHYKNKNHSEAIKLYNKILKNDPNNFRVCLLTVEVIIDQSIISKTPITSNKFLRLYYNCLINCVDDIYLIYKKGLWNILNKLNDYLEIDSSPRIKSFIQDHFTIFPQEDLHYIHKLLGRIFFITGLKQKNKIDKVYFLGNAERQFKSAIINRKYFSPTYQKHLANTFFELYKVLREEKYKLLAEKTFLDGYTKIVNSKNFKNEGYNSPQFLIEYSIFLDFIGDDSKRKEVLEKAAIQLKNIQKMQKTRKAIVDSVQKTEVDLKLLKGRKK